jgi:hypothetical protein
MGGLLLGIMTDPVVIQCELDLLRTAEKALEHVGGGHTREPRPCCDPHSSDESSEEEGPPEKKPHTKKARGDSEKKSSDGK